MFQPVLTTLCYFHDPLFLDVLFLSATVPVEKATLEKRVKELEEALASKDTEAENVAKDAAAREAEFVNRAAFLTQNVRGKIFCLTILPVYSNVYRVMLIFVSAMFSFVQKQHASPHLWIRRVAECHSTRL